MYIVYNLVHIIMILGNYSARNHNSLNSCIYKYTFIKYSDYYSYFER